MPIVHECSAPECRVLTMGVYCIEHELAEAADPHAATLVDALAVSPQEQQTDFTAVPLR